MNKIGFTPPVPEVVPRQLSEGEKPYILTRLEYLAIKLNVWWGSST